jgi:hypothetical protein
MMSPTASSVTCGIGVAVPIGVAEDKGVGGKGEGDEVTVNAKDAVERGCALPVAPGTIRVKGSAPAQAANPRLIIIRDTPKYIFMRTFGNLLREFCHWINPYDPIS